MANNGSSNASHGNVSHAAQDTSTPWYRAPIVWLGILLSVALIAGYSVLIYISHEQASHDKAGASIKHSEQLNQLFGVPFTRDQVNPAPPTTASAPAPAATPETP